MNARRKSPGGLFIGSPPRRPHRVAPAPVLAPPAARRTRGCCRRARSTSDARRSARPGAGIRSTRARSRADPAARRRRHGGVARRGARRTRLLPALPGDGNAVPGRAVSARHRDTDRPARCSGHACCTADGLDGAMPRDGERWKAPKRRHKTSPQDTRHASGPAVRFGRARARALTVPDRGRPSETHPPGYPPPTRPADTRPNAPSRTKSRPLT
ncbi:hypothetical protein C7408_13420 [Paraburkholderia caballeronis]|nr:hypothetical protein C7408_13420 [Paraburkholderia caballeronis]TDV17723.1 hypothetical protein C7404_13620 [Paraburkholderia caballeronis]TDV18753.1 hypothetical protein C7406_10420 [Paraburkholderia caballeronis]